jgi:hypothetical protein
MADPKQNDKGEEEKKPDFKKTAEYRQFRKLLRRVVKAPPMRKKRKDPITSEPQQIP